MNSSKIKVVLQIRIVVASQIYTVFDGHKPHQNQPTVRNLSNVQSV